MKGQEDHFIELAFWYHLIFLFASADKYLMIDTSNRRSRHVKRFQNEKGQLDLSQKLWSLTLSINLRMQWDRTAHCFVCIRLCISCKRAKL